jgi:hypothetical protein
MADPAVPPPTTEQTPPPQGTSTQTRTVEPLQMEEGQPRLQSTPTRHRIKTYSARLKRRLGESLGVLWTRFCVIDLFLMLLLIMPNGIWPIFAYYFYYAHI